MLLQVSRAGIVGRSQREKTLVCIFSGLHTSEKTLIQFLAYALSKELSLY